MKRKVVLGLGNILNGDEGAGVYALKELEKLLPEKLKMKIELVDGGVLGLDLLPYVEGASHLLILDAADTGAAPGTVVEYQDEEINLFYHQRLSWHQLGFQEVLAVAKIRHSYPDSVYLIGVQPENISPGVGLSQKLKKPVKHMARRALDIIRDWKLLS
ncbi:MAG: HyaD/HybD family hydrogenase maturation endopeptidase [Acidobacteriota bacterium]|nr:HyaD/HybD family hydrogenase maturation endopeptidase [Acidobacteriota bacterium]MDW3229019.1 HyaD/HybD family hydrogenase maturation endopeptidase [Acidobacteriota bacterium]MDY0231013.1 HyaD/HybD family hydrogenase maturation endopeptidase [Candidatus Saccharicenans sp.]